MSATIEKLVGPTLLHGTSTVNTADVLKDKLVALYFSAHWCPPCRQFTPEFAKIYNHLTSSNKPFAVIFVSADQDSESFSEYYGEQPWYAIPYDLQDVRDKLSEHFGIRGIPALIVLNTDGKIISKEGRLEIMKKKEKAFDAWEKEAQGHTTQGETQPQPQPAST